MALLVGALMSGAAHAQVTWDAPKLFSDPFFDIWPDWATQSNPGYVSPDIYTVADDFDGDGDVDIALTMSLQTAGSFVINQPPPGPIWFLENDGHGNLTHNDAKFLDGTFPGMRGYQRICYVDVNRDGHRDMFIESTGYESGPDNINWLGERQRLMLRQPDGRFKDVTDTNMPTHKAFAHRGSCLFDFNGDGAPDYFQNSSMTPKSPADNLELNDGTGKYTVVADMSFDPADPHRLVGPNSYLDPIVGRCYGGIYNTQPVRPAPWAVANIYFGEMINVGAGADLNTCPEGTTPAYVNVLMKNDGTGHFLRSLTDLPPRPAVLGPPGNGAAPNIIEVADIDDDGDDDLLLAINVAGGGGGSDQYLQILKQDAPGHFIDWTAQGGLGTADPFQRGQGGGGLFIADFNGDGAPDIYTSKFGDTFSVADGREWLFLNDGYGKFNLVQGFNPLNGGTVGVADLNGDGWVDILHTIQGAFPGKPGPALEVTYLHGPTAASIVGAVAPLTRSVQAGQTATAFATIVNASDKPLLGCRIKPPRTRASTFSYQATDPATNAPIGSPNAEMTIAPNGFQSFVFAVSVTGQATGEDLQIQLDCRNTKDAPRIDGLSMFRFSASSTPSPDVVPIALTPSGDGVMRLTGAGRSGFFVAAGINIGAAGQVIVKPVATTAIPATLTICESASNGTCLAPPAAQISVAFGANQTKTFSVFGAATADFAPDFANKRVLLDFTAASSLVGRASVAVATGP